jgi:hypothetical protein
VRRIQHNPAVRLALDSAHDGNEIVMIDGRAILLDDPTIRPTMPVFADKYASLRHSTAEAWDERFSQAIRITPIRFIRWRDRG